MTADGLVGKVSTVAGHQAQVTLLTDPNLKVSALDLEHQATGIVGHGQGEGTLTLDRVQKSQVLEPGDTIVTQGWKFGDLTSIYPAGIPIGYISGASQSEVDLYWEAQVSPRVHFDSLRTVIVEPDAPTAEATRTPMYEGTLSTGGGLLPGRVVNDVPHRFAGLVDGSVTEAAKPLKAFGALPPVSWFAVAHWAPHQ